MFPQSADNVSILLSGTQTAPTINFKTGSVRIHREPVFLYLDLSGESAF